MWSLPQAIISAIEGVPAGDVPAPADDDEAVRNLSVLANELCGSFLCRDAEATTAGLEALCARFAATSGLETEFLFKLFEAAYEKLKQFAPIFEINVAESHFCKSVEAWLAHRRSTESANDQAAAAG